MLIVLLCKRINNFIHFYEDLRISKFIAELLQPRQRSQEALSDGDGDTQHRLGGGRTQAIPGVTLQPKEETPVIVHSQTEAENVTND